VEASGPTPPGALHPDDVPDVAAAFDARGPFLTVLLTTEAAIPNASQRAQLRWRDLREQAAAAGADDDTLAEIDPLVPDAHHEGDALAVIASPTGVHVVEHGGEAPPRDHARWSPLPSPGIVLAWRQAGLPYLVVNADRTGADLVVIRPGPRPAEEHLERAGGAPGPVHKFGGGGWSQRRFAHRVENTWKQNANDAAEHVTRFVDEHGIPLVVVTGEVRALELLDEALPERVEQITRPVDDARQGDGTLDERSPGIRRLLATVAAEQTVALLRKFEEEVGQADRAANGPVDTIAALARAQVDVLLVHDDPDDDRVAWCGPKPLDVATSLDDLRALGVDGVHEGRLVDVALRAAFGSGAGIRIVPHAGALAGGIGALLRWSEH
jgi:hypothetical protein